MNGRWVVTGGVGFIGYHVCDALCARGDEVIILDTFGGNESAERNLRDLSRAHGSIPTVKASIVDRDAIAPAFGGADGVIHLAATPVVRDDTKTHMRVNVEGTANVIESALAAGIRRVVIASSSSVYGDATPLPAREDEPAVEPVSPYAASKRAAELVASALASTHPQLCAVSVRPFSVYGPRLRSDLAIAKFVQAAIHGHPVTLHGDGMQQRDFTHVSDVVRGILAAADRAQPGFRIYNLGAGSPVSMNDLVYLVGQVVGREPAVTRVPEPPGNARATYADISRAKIDLDWRPRVKLSDGLATVRDWLLSS